MFILPTPYSREVELNFVFCLFCHYVAREHAEHFFFESNWSEINEWETKKNINYFTSAVEHQQQQKTTTTNFNWQV